MMYLKKYIEINEQHPLVLENDYLIWVRIKKQQGLKTTIFYQK